ncbi:BspA family leucine-rich repeat surface protein [Ruminococcus sp.]|uniref:BspA family leucine-rich repeat surface protein n=1 Tax=Ruminococcus sp. TaxID=41978 RepID=UPI00258ED912|nr:BspA family leucine-rich repeat surface protein [Ruminococcus sp.]MCR5020130.1 DUF285 domain-containing protein [Ruminococcus sp.]
MNGKRFLAVVMSLCMLYGEASYGVPFIKQSITAQAANIEGDYYYFDEALGVLTLSGTVENDLPLHYSMDGNVRTIIAASGTILPEDCSSLFAGYYNCTSIDLHNADTSNVTNMQKMFHRCSKLKTLDVSSFKTRNVTNMQSMFYECSDLDTLDVSSFDTSNVTDMSSMFDMCCDLKTLDVSGLDTSNVTNMYRMFGCCSSLEELDLSNFDTSNVTNMQAMFLSGYNSNLTSLDVSSFDTSNVTNMNSMFSGCKNLISLDLGGFDTSNVSDMNGMFNHCFSLTSLDLRNFDTRKVFDMSFMFSDCPALTKLDVSSFDTSNVTNMNSMFYGCKSLTSLDLGGFDTSNATDMKYMFTACSALTKLDVSSFDTSEVTNMSCMFNVCSALTKLDVSSFDTSKVTDISAMFSGCSALTKLDVSSFDTSNVTNMGSMFADCSALTKLDVSSFDTSKVTSMNGMFGNCKKLKTLYLGDNFKKITEDYCLPNFKGWVNVKSPSTIISKDGVYAVFENNGKNTYILYGSDKTFPTNIKCNYSEKYHQLQFTWDKVEGAECYSIAVYMSGKWKIQSSNITTNSCVSPKNLTPGHTYKVAIAAKIDGEWDTANAIKNAVAVTIRYDSEDEVFVISDEWIDDSGSINGNNPEISQNDLDKLKSFNVRAKQTAVYSGNDIDKSSIRMKNELIAVRTRKKDVTDAVFSLTPSRNSDFAFTITGTTETMPEGEYTTEDFNSTVKIFYKEGLIKKKEKQVTPEAITPSVDGSKITYVFALEEGTEYSIYVNNPTNNHVGTYEIHVSEDNWVYAKYGGVRNIKISDDLNEETYKTVYLSDEAFYLILQKYYEIMEVTPKYNSKEGLLSNKDQGVCSENLQNVGFVLHGYDEYMAEIDKEDSFFNAFLDVFHGYNPTGDLITIAGIICAKAPTPVGIAISVIGIEYSLENQFVEHMIKKYDEEIDKALFEGNYNILFTNYKRIGPCIEDNKESVEAWKDRYYINKYMDIKYMGIQRGSVIPFEVYDVEEDGEAFSVIQRS